MKRSAPTLVLLALACSPAAIDLEHPDAGVDGEATGGTGGEGDSGSPDDGSGGDAGSPSGGTMASGGAGSGGADAGSSGSAGVAGSTGGGTAQGGSATGGATEMPPIDLGDGDHAGDGRPVVPVDSTGGFFWGGCEDSWRIGNWFVTSDRQRDAFSREIVPPRDGSTSARGVTGSDFANGVVLWVQLDHPLNRPVNLTGCSAMRFWGRLDSPSGRVVVALNDGSRGSGLLEGRSSLPSRTLAIGSDWQEFVLPFESFPIETPPPDDRLVASIEFFVGDGGESFDLWVDELALVCTGGCP